MRSTVLVVGSRKVARHRLRVALEDQGFGVVEARDGMEGFECFQREAPEWVVTDLEMPRCDGIGLVRRIGRASSVPVIVYTPGAGVCDAVAAVKSGAHDFVDSSELGVDEFVARAASRFQLETRGDAGSAALLEELPGRSPSILKVRERVKALAPLSEPVLVTGEPGTGRKSTQDGRSH